MLELEGLSGKLIGAAIEIHRELGPGFLESVYEECLCQELARMGIACRAQIYVPLFYKGTRLKSKHRIDLLVENQIIVEVKSVEKILLVHECQLYSYLRAAQKTVGFIFNFNTPLMKDGIHRRVLTPKSRMLY